MKRLEVFPTPSADDMAAIAAALAVLARDAATMPAVAAGSINTRCAWREKTRPRLAPLNKSWTETARLEALDAGV